MATEILRPNAAGTISEMDGAQGSGSPANKVVAVYESVADDLVSYVYEPRNGYREFYNLPSTAISGGTISNVRVFFRWREVDPISSDSQVGLYIGSTEYYSSSFNNSSLTTFQDYSYDWATNPATSAAWTTSDLDSLQIGMKKVSGGGHQYTQIYLETTYTTSSIENSDFFLFFN